MSIIETTFFFHRWFQPHVFIFPVASVNIPPSQWQMRSQGTQVWKEYTAWNLQLGLSTADKTKGRRPLQRVCLEEAAARKVQKPTLSWHCSTSKGTWISPPRLSILYYMYQISKCVRENTMLLGRGNHFFSPLTHIPGWRFPVGTAEINLGLPWWRRVSSLAAAVTAFYLQLTDGDKGSLKAILRQLRTEQDKWGSCEVSFPWKPSATNTLLSSVQDVYTSHINAGVLEKFAQWMPVL